MKNLNIVFLSEWLNNPYKDLLSEKLEAKGAKVREYFWSTFFAPIVLKAGKPDVLHLHTLHPFLRGKSRLSKFLKLYCFAGQIFLLKLLGVKTVWTVHEWTDKLNTGSSEISPSYCTLIGKIFHGFIVHDKLTKEVINQKFQLNDRVKIKVIPHGNYIEFYENKISQQDARQYLKIPDDNFVFLIFGSIYRYKGVLEALRAFKKLDLAQATLIVAGKPGEAKLKAEIEAEIKNSTQQIVFVPERIPDSDIQIYFNACNCVVVPYQIFTTSGVAVLATSFGRSCIAPKLGFFEDLFEGGGAFLYDAIASDGLTDALSQALQSQELIPAMEQKNFELAKSCSWEYVASQTLLAYQ